MKVLNSFLKRLHPKDKTSWIINPWNTLRFSSYFWCSIYEDAFPGGGKKKVFVPFFMFSVILQHLSHLSSSSLAGPQDKLVEAIPRCCPESPATAFPPAPPAPSCTTTSSGLLQCTKGWKSTSGSSVQRLYHWIPKNQNRGVTGLIKSTKHWKYSMFSVNPDRWNFTIYCIKHWACQFVWKINKELVYNSVQTYSRYNLQLKSENYFQYPSDLFRLPLLR